MGATEECVLLRIERLPYAQMLTRYQHHHTAFPRLAALSALLLTPPPLRTPAQVRAPFARCLLLL